MPSVKKPTKTAKTATVKVLTALLEGTMSQGDRAALVRSIQILKGER